MLNIKIFKASKFFFLGVGLLIVVGVSSWFLIKKALLKGTQKSQVQSPCRLSPFAKPLGGDKKNRIEKLDHLMEQPLDWLISDIYGEVIDFYCLRGKKRLVLNFWATWCPPCVQELSSLSKLATLYKDDIFVVAISSQDISQIESFLTRAFSKSLSQELKFASIKTDEQRKYFPKDPLPVTYIFDKQGLLKIKETGYRDWLDAKVIESLLSL